MKQQKTLKDFTPAIQAKIPEYIKKYTEGIYDGGRYNAFKKEDADALINWNYEKANFKKPCVLVAENPYEAQVMFNYIKANEKVFIPILYLIYCVNNGLEIPKELKFDEKKSNQLYSQLNSQLRDQLDGQLYSQLDNQLYSQLDSQLRDQLNSQLRDQLDNQLNIQLSNQLDNQLRDQLKTYNNCYLFTSNIHSNTYGAWFKFMKDEFNLSAEINVMLDSWNELYQKSNVYNAIFSELLCVVSKYPKKINKNQGGLLHKLDGVAAEWGGLTDETKFECYYINGRNLPSKYFNSISEKTFSLTDFINETNEEYKSTCIAFMQEKWGEEHLVNFFREHLKEIDTFVDKKDKRFLEGTTSGMNVGVYTLFKGEINGENIAYVRCYDYSTDRMFFLGVDDKHNNAKDSIASLYRLPKKLIGHIKSISRQGERFSTILTDDGKKLLKEMSEKEIADVSGITGSQYFSLMKFEY